MTALSVSAALSIATACAPAVDPHMVLAIGQHESGLDPLTIHDNNTGKSLHGGGVLATAQQLIAVGHSLDLGLMQINDRNLKILDLTLADAFDPCKSVAAAARLLALFSRYATGSPTRGIASGYASHVVALMEGAKKGVSVAPPLAPSTQATACARPDPDGWHISAAADGCPRTVSDWHVTIEETPR